MNRSERFIKVATKKVDKVFDALKSLELCSNKNNYQFSINEVEEIFNEIKSEVQRVECVFKEEAKKTRKLFIGEILKGHNLFINYKNKILWFSPDSREIDYIEVNLKEPGRNTHKTFHLTHKKINFVKLLDCLKNNNLLLNTETNNYEINLDSELKELNSVIEEREFKDIFWEQEK